MCLEPASVPEILQDRLSHRRQEPRHCARLPLHKQKTKTTVANQNKTKPTTPTTIITTVKKYSKQRRRQITTNENLPAANKQNPSMLRNANCTPSTHIIRSIPFCLCWFSCICFLLWPFGRTLDIGGQGRRGIRVLGGPCRRPILCIPMAVQFGGPRCGWDQVGVR